MSQSTADDLVALAGADRAKIHVVYEAADPLYQPPPTPPSARPGYMLFVSTIEPRKNLPTLLEAYRLLLDRGRVQPVPPLRVVGQRGWLYEDSLRRLRGWGWASRCACSARSPRRSAGTVPGGAPVRDAVAL